MDDIVIYSHIRAGKEMRRKMDEDMQKVERKLLYYGMGNLPLDKLVPPAITTIGIASYEKKGEPDEV